MASSLRKRRTVLMVVVIVIATALLFAYANLLKIQNALLLAARDPIEKALEEALGVNVEIGSITGKNLSEVIISDLSVFAKSSADSCLLYTSRCV